VRASLLPENVTTTVCFKKLAEVKRFSDFNHVLSMSSTMEKFNF